MAKPKRYTTLNDKKGKTMTQSERMYQKIKDTLCIYHEEIKIMFVDVDFLSADELTELKGHLTFSRIHFERADNFLICTLTERERERIRKIYTPEAVRRIEKEEQWRILRRI